MRIKKDFIGMFDVLKGICMLIVITVHSLSFTNSVYPGSGFVDGSLRFFESDVLIMALFFIFTGYSFRPVADTKKFIKKQARQYLLPYAIVVLLAAAAVSLRDLMTGDFTIGSLSSAILGGLYGATVPIQPFGKFWIGGIVALWFFLALFFGSLIYNLIWQLKNPKHSCVLIWILTALAVAVPSSLAELCPWTLVQSFAVLGFMEIGRLLKKHKLLYKKLSVIFVLAALALWAFSHMYSFANVTQNEYRFLWLDYIEAGMAAVVVMKAYLASGMAVSDALAPLEYVGRYSMWFYCIHSFELLAFPWDERAISIFPAGISPVWVFVIAEVARIAFAVLMCMCINYIYGKILLRRLKDE